MDNSNLGEIEPGIVAEGCSNELGGIEAAVMEEG